MNYAPHPLLTYACRSGEKMLRLHGHITKIELHDSITTVDYGIRCGQE